MTTNKHRTPPALATMGERVKAARKAKKMTQERLAEAIGVTRNTITLLETGATSTLSAENTKACADALGLPVNYLIHGEPFEPGWAVTEEPAMLKLSPDAAQVAIDYAACPPAIRTAARELLRLGAGRI